MKYLLIAFFASLVTVSSAQQSKSQAKKWQKDLNHLYDKMQKKHVDLYHQASQEQLDSAFNRLMVDIPHLQNHEILVRMAQFVALVGDGHTSFFPGNQRKMWFRFLPVKFWYFPDGIRVIDVSEPYLSLLGKKLLKIGNVSVDEAYARIATTIGVDNDVEFQYSIPFQFVRPELLQALDIIESSDSVYMEFEGDVGITFASIVKDEWHDLDWRCANGIYPDGKSPSQRLDFLFASDLTLEHLKERKYYWYVFLEEKEAIYFQYNVCWDQKKRPTFKDVAQEMLTTFDSADVNKLIIDVRQNSGGEPLIAKYLVDELNNRKSGFDNKRVYVLVGRRTYSAALTNALQLRKAGSIVVGEPSRGKPNNPSEGRDIIMKSMSMWATVSTQFVERDEDLGDAYYIPIDHPVEQTYQDYRKGVDTVLEYALGLE